MFCVQPMEVQEGYGFGSGEYVCLVDGRLGRVPCTHSSFYHSFPIFEQMIPIQVQSPTYQA